MIMEQVLNLNDCQIAEVELIYKSKVKASERPCIKSSKDAASLLQRILG